MHDSGRSECSEFTDIEENVGNIPMQNLEVQEVRNIEEEQEVDYYSDYSDYFPEQCCNYTLYQRVIFSMILILIMIQVGQFFIILNIIDSETIRQFQSLNIPYYENEFISTLDRINNIIYNLNISYYEDEFMLTIKNINETVNRTNTILGKLENFFPH